MLREQRLREFKSKDFMSDEREIEIEKLTIQSIAGNKHMRMKRKGNGANWELSHV